jgi:hypothetical protein
VSNVDLITNQEKKIPKVFKVWYICMCAVQRLQSPVNHALERWYTMKERVMLVVSKPATNKTIAESILQTF